MQSLRVAFLALLALLGTARAASASSVAERVSGRIVLQVQQNGEAWYIYPADLHRYYLGRPEDTLTIMKQLGMGITDEDLAEIPVSGSSGTGNTTLRNRLSGYILLQVEQNGEAWYVYPTDTHRYYLGRPDDAFQIMRDKGLGITNDDLATIPIGEISESGTTSTVSSVLKTIVGNPRQLEQG